MKFTIRTGILMSIAFLMVVGLVFGPTQSVHAQDNCFGLSADDCALAKASMGPFGNKLSSFNMDYQITLVTTGSRNDVDLSVKGSGPFEFDRTGAGVGGLDITKLDAALSKLTLANTIATSIKVQGQTNTNNFEFRIVNGTLYFMGDKVTNGKWMSLDLKSLAAMRAGRGAGLPGLGGMAGRMANPAAMLQYVAAMQKLAAVPGFIKAERTADTTVENQQIASFVYHIDLATLFGSAEFGAFVQTMMSQAPNAATMPKLNASQMQAIGAKLSAAFKNTTLTVTRLVGVTDKLPHGLGVDLVSTINPADFMGMGAMMAAQGGLGAIAPTPDASQGPVNINFHFLVNLTGIGSKANVTAPEGATPFTMGAGMMPGMMLQGTQAAQ